MPTPHRRKKLSCLPLVALGSVAIVAMVIAVGLMAKEMNPTCKGVLLRWDRPTPSTDAEAAADRRRRRISITEPTQKVHVDADLSQATGFLDFSWSAVYLVRAGTPDDLVEEAIHPYGPPVGSTLRQFDTQHLALGHGAGHPSGLSGPARAEVETRRDQVRRRCPGWLGQREHQRRCRADSGRLVPRWRQDLPSHNPCVRVVGHHGGARSPVRGTPRGPDVRTWAVSTRFAIDEPRSPSRSNEPRHDLADLGRAILSRA